MRPWQPCAEAEVSGNMSKPGRQETQMQCQPVPGWSIRASGRSGSYDQYTGSSHSNPKPILEAGFPPGGTARLGCGCLGGLPLRGALARCSPIYSGNANILTWAGVALALHFRRMKTVWAFILHGSWLHVLLARVKCAVDKVDRRRDACI